MSDAGGAEAARKRREQRRGDGGLADGSRGRELGRRDDVRRGRGPQRQRRALEPGSQRSVEVRRRRAARHRHGGAVDQGSALLQARPRLCARPSQDDDPHAFGRQHRGHGHAPGQARGRHDRRHRRVRASRGGHGDARQRPGGGVRVHGRVQPAQQGVRAPRERRRVVSQPTRLRVLALRH